VVATHYEGDPCDNSKKAHKWLRDTKKDKSNSSIFKGVDFMVFGLGDSTYELYNEMGRFFNDALEELGATRAYRYGEGNAEGNKTEDDFNTWKLALWEELVQYYTQHPVTPSLITE
jgi:NADPH-ferrihemoprotein reductase